MRLRRGQITDIECLPEKNDTGPCSGHQRSTRQLNSCDGMGDDLH